MTNQTIETDIAYLTDTLRSPVEQLLLLRPSLESALFKLGHPLPDIQAGLDAYYGACRTVH